MSAVDVARAVWGGLLVSRPDRVAVLYGARRDDRVAVTALRVLGTRHAVQAGVQASFPTPAVRTAGSVVDGLHALSMVALAVAAPTWRRPALTSAAVTTALLFADRSVGRPMR